ncbi:MAG: hypothetical protein AAF846_14675 [Chloroflexota bacterium]
MQKWTESELGWYLQTLEENDTYRLALALSGIAKISTLDQPVPTGNSKVINHLEILIEDNRMCMVNSTIPPSYGEMRWLAARILACEYAYLGIKKSIVLENVVQPIKGRELDRISPDKPMTLDERAKAGLLPTKTEIINPQDYVDCCSKEAVGERRRNQNKNDL